MLSAGILSALGKRRGKRGRCKNVFKSGNSELGGELAHAFQLGLFGGGQGQNVVVDVPVQMAALYHLVTLPLPLVRNYINQRILFSLTNSFSLALIFSS
jgi:hypothetical protein